MSLLKKAPQGATLALAALLSLPASIVHAESTPPPERTFLLDSVATYQDSGQISENAKAECGLERLIPQAAEKFAAKYKVQIALSDAQAASAPAPSSSTRVSLQIADLVAGRAGSGFGGQWVVSEVSVLVSVKQGAEALAKTTLSCKAGLGANPFANFKACDRLERCAEQLGAKTARWLKTVARRGGQASNTASSPPEGAASE